MSREFSSFWDPFLEEVVNPFVPGPTWIDLFGLRNCGFKDRVSLFEFFLF